MKGLINFFIEAQCSCGLRHHVLSLCSEIYWDGEKDGPSHGSEPGRVARAVSLSSVRRFKVTISGDDWFLDLVPRTKQPRINAWIFFAAAASLQRRTCNLARLII